MEQNNAMAGQFTFPLLLHGVRKCVRCTMIYNGVKRDLLVSKSLFSYKSKADVACSLNIVIDVLFIYVLASLFVA